MSERTQDFLEDAYLKIDRLEWMLKESIDWQLASKWASENFDAYRRILRERIEEAADRHFNED